MEFRCDHCIERGVDAEREGLEEEARERGEVDGSGSREQNDGCSCNQILKVQFKDSFRHLSSSLDKLTESLKTKTKPLHCQQCTSQQECDSCITKLPIQRVFTRTYEYVESTFGIRHLPLLLQKQVYPYGYIDAYSKLEETSLPGRDQFYDILQEREVSPLAYNHAVKTWNDLGFQTLGEYCQCYLTLDILLLGTSKTWVGYTINHRWLNLHTTFICFFAADILRDYQRLSQEFYHLDALRFMMLPSLSLQSAIKMSGVELELISDPTLHLFWERMI